MSLNDKRHMQAEIIRQRQRINLRARRTFMIDILGGAALLGAISMGYITISPEQAQAIGKYMLANICTFVLKDVPADPVIELSYHGWIFHEGMKELSTSGVLKNDTIHSLKNVALGGFLGFLAGCSGLWLTAKRRQRRQDELLADRVIKGTRVVTEAELSRQMLPANTDFAMRFGTVFIPRNLETRHICLASSTGGGKSTLIREILDVIEARGECALIYDTSGEFIAHYYNPLRSDVILNPFDRRGTFWNPFSEMSHPADADRIAHHLISETGNSDCDVWLETARILVANMLRTLWQEGRGTLPALLAALQSMSREEMERWLAHTSSARTFAEDADRATGSVLFMLAKAADLLKFLRAAPREGEEEFSFAQFTADLDVRRRRPWIFVPRKEDYFEAFRPLMALWLECAASSMLGLAPSASRRLWFILDEIADLPRVANLTRLLPEGRKFGASVILTFQAIGQMRDRYGQDGAEALLGCCNTKLFMQLADQSTRRWASETIGNVEVEFTTISDSIDPQTGEVRTTVGSTRQVRAAVLESEFRLPPYVGYLLLPNGLPTAKIRLTDEHIRARGAPLHRRYIPADPKETLWGGLKPVPTDGETSTTNPGPTRWPGPV